MSAVAVRNEAEPIGAAPMQLAGVGGYQPGSPLQRAVSSVLSLVVIAIALLLALLQSGVVAPPKEPSRITSFNVAGSGESPAPRRKAKETRKQREVKQTDRQPRDQVRQAPVVEPVPHEAPDPAFSFLRMSKSEFASADIAGMKAKSGGSAGGPSLAQNTYGPGEGPGGATLYNADWFRRPSHAQLGGYLPTTAPPSGWGMIACQTIDHYRVENCQILDESPRGSGFARAVLNAAWQFQVIPPRLNGKQQLGTWVRIRIDYGAISDAG